MQITFDYYEIQEAIQLLLKEKAGIEIDLEDINPHDYPDIVYHERDFVYKKHKNGKEIKDKNGIREIDWDKSEYKKKSIVFDDTAEITFWVGK